MINIPIVLSKFRIKPVWAWSRNFLPFFLGLVELCYSLGVIEFDTSSSIVYRNHEFADIRKIAWLILPWAWNSVIFYRSILTIVGESFGFGIGICDTLESFGIRLAEFLSITIIMSSPRIIVLWFNRVKFVDNFSLLVHGNYGGASSSDSSIALNLINTNSWIFEQLMVYIWIRN